MAKIGELHKKYADLIKSGKISYQYLVDKKFDMKDIIEIMMRATIIERYGFSKHKGRSLAQRYHFLLLNKLMNEDPDHSRNFRMKEKSFRLYEKKVQDISNGDVSEEEIEYLKSLPKISDKINGESPYSGKNSKGFYDKYVYEFYFNKKPISMNDIF